jgi:DNA repair exonuclease SbcCD ATPase subunit
MKILDLHAKNFLTIGANSPLLSLNGRGLLLIAGDNRDDPSTKSNGAGKSSIPDALCWVLNAITARGEAGDAVVNDKAKKNCEVTVRLLDGEIVYRIIRYRKHTTGKNQATIEMWPDMAAYDAGAAPTRLDKGIEKETQEVIQQILGCSPAVFMASIYAGQEMMPDLPGMTDKELKTLIEEAAGVERLEKAYSLAKDNALKATTALQLHDAAFDRDKITRANIEQQILKALDAVAAYDTARPVEAVKYADAIKALKAQVAQHVAVIKGINEKALTDELADISTKLAANKVYETKKLSLVANLTSYSRHLAVVKTNLTNAVSVVMGIQGQVDNSEAEMSKPCPECGKPHTPEDLGLYKGAAIVRLNDAKAKADSLMPEVAMYEESVKNAQDELQAFEATIPDLSALASRVGVIQSTLKGYVDAKNKVALIVKDVEANVAASATVMTAINPHKATFDAYTAQLIAADSKLSELASKRVVLEIDHVLAENVASVFSPSGVRAHVLDTITPFLNERTAVYLAALSEGNISAVWSTLTTTAKGELREKFNIEVVNATGGKSFGVLSGGEKRKVRLSTMLALQDLVATRATKPIELWIGDEIDHALDDPGLERLMGILEAKARERGTVLIISHNELADWCDNVVTVVKEGGQSHIEGALA